MIHAPGTMFLRIRPVRREVVELALSAVIDPRCRSTRRLDKGEIFPLVLSQPVLTSSLSPGFVSRAPAVKRKGWIGNGVASVRSARETSFNLGVYKTLSGWALDLAL